MGILVWFSLVFHQKEKQSSEKSGFALYFFFFFFCDIREFRRAKVKVQTFSFETKSFYWSMDI